MRSYLLFSILFIAASCGGGDGGNVNSINKTSPANANRAVTAVPMYTYEIVKVYPHDAAAFTQGLVFADGILYEGTGGQKSRGDDFTSSLRRVELDTGKVLQKYDLPPEYFGEGITLLGGKIYQLTWREQTAFVYDAKDLKLLREFRYAGEGWGLADDDTNLYMSDGTHVIRVINPEDFSVIRSITVNDERGKPLMKLNELEWVNGEIWANVWETGYIVRIDPADGKLLGRIDLTKLADQQMGESSRADVLNGIAYDPAADRLFITGKKWKRLFEIKVTPQGSK